MAEREDLQWLVIREFQGLWEAPNLAAPPNAAAVMSGCYPSASGLLPVGKANALPAPGFQSGKVNGLTAVGPVQRAAGGQLSADLWAAGPAFNTNGAMQFLRFRQDTQAWESFYVDTPAGSTHLQTSPVWFAQLRVYGAGTPPGSATVFLVAGYNDVDHGIRILTLPNTTTPTLDTAQVIYLNGAQVLGAMTSHQGRVCWLESLYSVPNGGLVTGVVDFPLIRFTDVNSVNVAASGDYFGLTSAGNALAGFLIGTDVGDLLLARSRDVHLIQGDINAPGGPVDRVLSFFTGAAQQLPAVTTEGVFFGRSDGPVVFWGGGAGTQDVSFGLKPGFWARTDLSMTGAFTWSEPFVLAPNGYMFDTRTRAWFKHPALANVFHWATPYLGVPFFASSTPLLQIAWAAETANGNVFQVNLSEDSASPRTNTWTWQSVPFTQEKVPYNQIREVFVLVQNWSAATTDTNTVTLMLKDRAGASYTAPAKTTAVGSAPQLLRFLVPVATESNQVQLTLTATGGSGSAGIVKEIRVGYRKATGVPRTGE